MMMMTANRFIDSLGSDFWSSKTKDQVAFLMGDDVAAMVGFDQKNPNHCYDLFTHTVQTVNNCSDGLVQVAAFFHDIGKPHVASEKNGGLVYYKHATKSADIARSILKELRYSDWEIDLVAFLISHHDDFISFDVTKDGVHKYLRRLIHRNQGFFDSHLLSTTMESLLELCIADAKAQADWVVVKGVMVNSKKQKLEKLAAISDLIMEVIKEGMDA